MDQRKFSALGVAYDAARATVREAVQVLQGSNYMDDLFAASVSVGGFVRFADDVRAVVNRRRHELAEEAYNAALVREAQAREDLLAALQETGAEYASTVTLDGPLFDVAAQLQTPLRDGDLMDKQARTILVGAKLAWRCEGWNGLTREGMRVLAEAERRLEGIPEREDPTEVIPERQPMTAHFQTPGDLEGLARHEAAWPEVQAEAANVVHLSTPAREDEWKPSQADLDRANAILEAHGFAANVPPVAPRRTATEDEPAFWLHRRVNVRELPGQEGGTVVRARRISGTILLNVRLDGGGEWQGPASAVAVPTHAN